MTYTLEIGPNLHSVLTGWGLLAAGVVLVRGWWWYAGTRRRPSTLD